MATGRGTAGAHSGLSGLELALPLRVVARYALFTAFFAASLMFYVWSRLDAQATSAELDLSMRRFQTLQVEARRLELELATRRNLAGLEAGAELLKLEAVPVQELVLP